MPSSEPSLRPARRRCLLMGLVLGLLWWAFAWGAWPLAWSLAIKPSLDRDRPGLTALVYERPTPGGKARSSLSLTSAQAELDKPDTSMRAYGFWLVPAPGDYTLLLACDDAGRLKLDGRTLLTLEGVSADNHAAVSLELEAGPHLLEVELLNGPGRGFFRLLAQAPGEKASSLLEADQLRKVNLGNFDFWAGLADGAEAARGWGLGGLACLLILLGLGCLGLFRTLALWTCLAVTLAGGLADVYLERGLAMTEAACRQSTVLGELRKMELYLRSPAHLQARRERSGLLLLGDSGHLLHPGSGDHLLYVMRDMVKAQGREREVEVYGVAHPGFQIHDYYFLLNHLASQHPKLVIIPINLRTFGAINRKYWFDELYGYVQWAELLHPAGISSASRPLPRGVLLAAKLESSFLTGYGLPFLQVARTRFQFGRDQSEQAYRGEIKQFTGWDHWMGPPHDRSQHLGAEWSEVTPEHYLMPVFRRVTALAAANGITVLYYAVPMNPDTKYLRPGFVRDAYDVIARQVNDPPRAHFLDLSNLPIDDDTFVDGLEHFTPSGKRRISKALLNAAWPLVEKSREREGGR